MFLSDRDIEARIADFNFTAEDASAPFQPAEQVQSCTVDLRLSGVFWKPLSSVAIDLRKPTLEKSLAKRRYRKLVIRPGEAITLKPGRMLLARTMESFRVPNDLVGELLGKSTYSRLGLAVSVSGLINPGWRGRMPLQLVNLARFPIRVTPNIPICQVRFFKLSSEPGRPYGHPGLDSKYQDDNGGPSYWWRDRRIQELRRTLADSAGGAIEDEVCALLENEGLEVIQRLQRFMERASAQHRESADFLLEAFATSEDKRRQLCWAAGILFSAVLLPCLVTIVVGAFLGDYSSLLRVLAVAAILAVPVAAYLLYPHLRSDHFGMTELEKARQSIARLPSDPNGKSGS